MKTARSCSVIVAVAFVPALVANAANIVWTNLNGGPWNNPINWSPNQVPGPSDDVVITNSGTYGVSLNVNTTNASLTLGGGSGTQSLTNNSFTLSLAGAGMVKTNAQFLLGGGSVTGAGILSIDGTFIWTGGSLAGSGSVFANGSASISGIQDKILNGRELVNAGTAKWSGGGGRLVLQNGGVLSNAPAGTFDISFDASAFISGGTGLIANGGLLRQVAGTNGTAIQVALNNAGTVQIQAGALKLSGGGTQSGTFTISGGANLELATITNNFGAGSSVGGAGGFEVSSGTANFSGNYSITNGGMNISGGTVNLNGSGVISPAQLVISAGTLGGSNNVTVSGPITWTGGSLAGNGSVFANGSVSISGIQDKILNGRELVNGGAANWSGGLGRLVFQNGGVLSNAPAGTFDISFDAFAFVSGGTGLIANGGLLRQTAGTNGTRIQVAFNNANTVQVQAGALSLSGGGAHSGTFTVASGAKLEFGGGTNNLSAGSTIGSSGNFEVSGGTANLAGSLTLAGTNDFSGGTANFTGNYSVANGVTSVTGGTMNLNGSGTISPAQLVISLGTLGGSNDVTVSGPITWTGGSLAGSGSVFANGSVSISGIQDKVLNGRELVNGGAATWSSSGGRLVFQNGGVLSNAPAGTFDISFDASALISGGTGLIANGGLLRQTAGTNGTAIQVAFINSGVVDIQAGALKFNTTNVQTSGITQLSGGNMATVQPFQLLGGVLAGTGTISGSVTNRGSVSPGASPGQLTVTGVYTQPAGGTLNIELAGQVAQTNFDRFIVSNSVVLAGTLNVFLTNGFYPKTNATFAFLLSTNLKGGFTAFNYPSNDVGMAVSYDSSNAVIQVINVRPVLPELVDTNIDEMVLFSVNAAAVDDDRPPQTLTYTLTNSPAGASVDPTGLITWAPTEDQGPMTTNITVLVTDNGTPNLQVARTFRVAVNEINRAASLVVPADQAIDEQAPFIAQATANDPDIPINPLTFELVSGPAGLTVSPTGAIAWTPLEDQGPNVYTVTLRVTDLNTNATNAQQLSATNHFVLTVNEVNRPPVLTVPADLTLLEQTPLNVTATATDPDIPPNPVAYALISPPSGMNIDRTSGAISWTPSESQGPSTNVIVVTATDTNAAAINGRQLTVTNTFSVIVTESNQPPFLPLQTNRTINELTTLWVTNTASDPDLPANKLVYSLLAPPPGASIDTNGVISWTPSEAQGPATNLLTTVVTDSNPSAVNAQQLSVTNSFIVVVNESNAPPSLTLILDQTINPGSTLLLTNVASDPDIPANPLTFALLSAPAGAAVNSTNGVFSWSPAPNQSGTTNLIQVQVTDDNTWALVNQHLTATQAFTVIVRSVPPIALQAIEFKNGNFSMEVNGPAGHDYTLLGSTNLTTWTGILTTNPPNTPFQILDPAAGTFTTRFYRVRVGP